MPDDHRALTAEAAEPQSLRLTEDEFDMLIRSGAAARLGRLELRDGELYRMNAQYAPHMRMKLAIYKALEASLSKAGIALEAGVESTVRFQEYWPIPDVFIFTPNDQSGAIPAADVRLIVEVSDTTLGDDLGYKRDRYAAGELAEYWVIDMQARIVLQHWAPKDGVFTQARTIASGAPAISATLPGVAIETKDLPWKLG